MNLEVNNLKINGKLSFQNNGVIDSNLLKGIRNITQIERNEIANKTSLLNDDFQINKSLYVTNTINSPLVKVTNVSFNNDLDELGVPVIQNVSFTGELRNKINNVHNNLGEIIPDIIDQIGRAHV